MHTLCNLAPLLPAMRTLENKNDGKEEHIGGNFTEGLLKVFIAKQLKRWKHAEFMIWSLMRSNGDTIAKEQQCTAQAECLRAL